MRKQCKSWDPFSQRGLQLKRTMWLQGSFTGRFTRKWLLEECSMSLERVARSGKPQALMAAGALAGLSGAFSASEVCFYHL